jgi:hypothetical protein
VALDEESQPEPDVTVVAGGPRDDLSAHPSRPVLVVDVALAGLALDRGEKASLYARAGLADYRIVNLVDQVPRGVPKFGSRCRLAVRLALRGRDDPEARRHRAALVGTERRDPRRGSVAIAARLRRRPLRSRAGPSVPLEAEFVDAVPVFVDIVDSPSLSGGTPLAISPRAPKCAGREP